MSGEKCGRYRVDRNAQREARRLQEAQTAAAKSRDRLDAVLARGPSLAAGEQPPEFDPAAGTEALNAYVAAANKLSATLERRIANREALKDLLATSGGHAGTWSGPSAEVPATAERPPAQEVDATEQADRSALVDRLLGRLREASAEEMAEVRSLADALLAAGDRSAAEGLEKELRRTLQQANVAADARRARAGRAEQLLARLRGLDGKEVAGLRVQLERAANTGEVLPAGLEEAVAGAESRATERSDREYVAQVFRQELSKCDYLVSDESFETAFVTGGRIVAEDERNPGYAIEIEADPANSGFEMRVVRLEDAPWSQLLERRDAEMEEQFCGCQARLRERLRGAGIESWLVRHEAAGAKPVAVVAPTTAGARRKKKTDRHMQIPRK